MTEVLSSTDSDHGQTPHEKLEELIVTTNPITGERTDDLGYCLIRDTLRAFDRSSLVGKLFFESLITV
jgi:hypothetical protein